MTSIFQHWLALLSHLGLISIKSFPLLHLAVFSQPFYLTIKEQQYVDCVICEREENLLLHPSLDPTYLC